jgi:hypothetical protein
VRQRVPGTPAIVASRIHIVHNLNHLNQPEAEVKYAIRLLGIASLLSAAMACRAGDALPSATPPAPIPEPISIEELPLPPTAPSQAAGSCSVNVNRHGTGCISDAPNALQAGSFLPDGHHVVAAITFVGAPAAPQASRAFSGRQLIIIKTDGSRFSNGDPWKCLTCGVPTENAVNRSTALDYPQTFNDGRRLLAGTNIIDCSPYLLTDDRCTPKRIHIFPIRWNVTPDGSGAGGQIRELRLHPDNVHLGFNGMFVSNGRIDQFAYLGSLEFDPAPASGKPLASRYDVTHVTRLLQEGLDKRTLKPDPQHPGELLFDPGAIDVGELRGFTKDGREVIYIGYPAESSNIDIFAADLSTGKVRRLTSNPEYTDPMDSSPDDQWIVAMDTRGSNRQMFVAALRGIPPITDMLTSAAVSSIRNNRDRRFFQPYLIDRYGDRNGYQGQQLNAGDGSPGSASDRNWNGMADPRWSPDGTGVIYWQALVTAPSCGGLNPLPCPSSTEPGGRRARLMLARLTSRKPLALAPPAPISDKVPWGTPYVSGEPMPRRASIPAGTYVLRGKVSGLAQVRLSADHSHDDISTVAVTYTNYSDDGAHVINGSESVTRANPSPTLEQLDWHSNLSQSGAVRGTKKTSADGFKLTIDIAMPVFQSKGTMTTTIDGVVYRQPGNGM